MAKTTDFTNFANERPNYFPGQYLLEDDFELQHKYLSDRQRYQNQSLHISGIIEGLEVVVVQNSKAVQIKSGSAIDSDGNLIILKQDNTFSGFKDITEGELYIQYSQDKQIKQQEGVDDSYTRWIEKPIIKFDPQTPQNGVKLAKLIIQGDTITLAPNVRGYSGLSLPNPNSKALTLRAGGDANPNLAVLTGSLKIDGDLTVAGTISGTIDTKNISSGILSVERIPNLSADKINSGILSVERIPSLSADKITSGSIVGDLTVNGATKLGYESNISNFGIPLMSGFYQNGGLEIAGDVPDTSHTWTHLITVRHSNVNNNHQLQIAASYKNNDRLFFRKVQSDSTTNPANVDWNEVATRGTNVFNGTQTITGSLTVNGAVQLGGFTDIDQDEWPQVTWYRDVSKNWDEGLIKHSSGKGIFKKAGYGIHFHQSREFGLWSTNWDALFAVEGQTGNTFIKGNVAVNGTIYVAGNPIVYENYEIYLRGSAFDSPEGNITFLKIANIDMGMPNARGLNTVILNSNGTFKNKANNDVHGNNASWNTWATWVNENAAIGDIVAVASFDALTIAPTGGSAETLLRSINAGRAFSTIPFRNPYTLLFIRGQSRCIEVSQPYQGNNAHLKTTYYQLLTLQYITQQEPWQTPTFQNGWVNYENTYNPAGYFKDSLGIVHLRGLVRSGTNNTTIFTLPVGYRPSNRELMSVQTNNNVAGRIDIVNDGQVLVISGNNGWISLDGITFRAA